MKAHAHIYDLIVIGGGPSGMMMAGRAAGLGARVLILEKNKILGKKLCLTGGGRCNITNAEFDVKEFLLNFPQSKEFLYSPFSKFSSKDTIEFFIKIGLPIVIESRKRAFPQSQKASDVVRAMERYIKKNNVEIRTNVRAVSFAKKGNTLVSVKTSKGEDFFSYNFAIATGGMAAPETGSNGEGFTMLESLGHKTIEPNPNVVPLTTNATWVHTLSGATLSFMTIRFVQNDKIKIKKTGKILFTHFGISGPLILNSAYEIKKLLKVGKVTAHIDMFPDTQENDLDKRVLNLFNRNKNKLIGNVLQEMLPKKLSEIIVNFPDIYMTETQVNSITKEQRKKIVKKMKNLTFEITGTLGFSKAVVADGGIPLEEVNFKEMASKIYPNLFLLGDVLNINRPSGGFSLQLCWTTGWVAGTVVGNGIKTT